MNYLQTFIVCVIKCHFYLNELFILHIIQVLRHDISFFVWQFGKEGFFLSFIIKRYLCFQNYEYELDNGVYCQKTRLDVNMTKQCVQGMN